MLLASVHAATSAFPETASTGGRCGYPGSRQLEFSSRRSRSRLARGTSLLAVMKWSGEFDERVLGPYAPFLDFGFYLGVPLGVCVIAALWLKEKRKP